MPSNNVPSEDRRETVLEVQDLRTSFRTSTGIIKAVNGLSYDVKTSECVGIVGESGCGKSAGAMSILRLIPHPPGLIEGGEVLFFGEDLLKVTEKRMRNIRGNRIAMIFQDATTSLNPVLTVGLQLSESLEAHQGFSRSEAQQESARLLGLVGIPDASKRIEDYPHQFSGGMQQRIMIAMALACTPDLIIADEPTTALDVTVQAQVLELLQELRAELNMAVLIITHNLGVVARYVDRVNVMYAGSVVETGPTDQIYASPKHPYTIGLLASVPRLDGPTRENLRAIDGLPPDLAQLPEGCAFAARCAYAMERCSSEKPTMEKVGPEHFRACFYDLEKLSR